MMRSLSIVIPVYNEAPMIPGLFQAVYDILPAITHDYELIMVDDASTDETSGLLKRYASHDERIKIIRNERNRTLGGTLKEGFRRCQKEVILYFDADLPFDLKEINKALEILRRENADFVSAYRINRNADGWKRTMYSYVYNYMVNFLFDTRLKDINFSFKLFKKEILDNILLESEGSFIDAELLIRSQREGFKIVQFPVRYHERKQGASTLSRPAVIVKILVELAVFCLSLFAKRNEKNKAEKTLWAFYGEAGFFQKLYICLRLRTAPFEKIEKYISGAGRILDLGCGIGIFSFWMAQASGQRRVTAIDWNHDRISLAKKASERRGIKIEFLPADIRQTRLPSADQIVLIDILYLFSDEEKKEILSSCFRALAPGGTLVLKEMDSGLRFKYAVCFMQEFFMTKILRRNLSRGVHIMSREKWALLLKETGFDITVLRLDQGYLYPHILFIGKK